MLRLCACKCKNSQLEQPNPFFSLCVQAAAAAAAGDDDDDGDDGSDDSGRWVVKRKI